jgi:hypothetical protein
MNEKKNGKRSNRILKTLLEQHKKIKRKAKLEEMGMFEFSLHLIFRLKTSKRLCESLKKCEQWMKRSII